MDSDGTLYLDENAPEEDQKRAEEWGNEIAEDEIRKQREEIEKVQRKLEKRLNG